MADKNVTPRSVLKINLGDYSTKGLSISTWLGSNTVSGTPTMTIYNSDGQNVTDVYGQGTSYSSSTKTITFGVYGADTGTFTIVFAVTLTNTTPDGTAGYFTVDLVLVVSSSTASATAATAELLESFALATLDDTKIACNLALGTTTNDTLLVHLINNATYQIEAMAGRRFYTTDYTNEKYDGTGHNLLFLRNFPIQSVDRVAIGTNDVLDIKNTAAYTNATVSVTSSAVVLKKDGTTDATLTFALYTTMTAMATAINAVGNNWSASLTSNQYANYKTTELLKRFGANAINNNIVTLHIPDDAEDEFEVYEKEGYVHFWGRFPRGNSNIFVSYNGGYTTIPYDLRDACTKMVKCYYNYAKNKGDKKSEAITSYSYSLDLLSPAVLKEIENTVFGYKKYNMG